MGRRGYRRKFNDGVSPGQSVAGLLFMSIAGFCLFAFVSGTEPESDARWFFLAFAIASGACLILFTIAWWEEWKNKKHGRGQADWHRSSKPI